MMMAQQQPVAGPPPAEVQNVVEAQPKHAFAQGCLVEVARRMEANSNKPGGVALVTSCNADGTYRIKYTVIGGFETAVEARYLAAHTEDIGRRPRRAAKPAGTPTSTAPPARKQKVVKKKKKKKSTVKAAAVAAMSLPVTFAAAARLKKKTPCASSSIVVSKKGKENRANQKVTTTKAFLGLGGPSKKPSVWSMSRQQSATIPESPNSATSTPAVSPVPLARPSTTIETPAVTQPMQAGSAVMAASAQVFEFEFAIGTQVDVIERRGPGVNKEGGVARVTKHNLVDGTYAVRFVLGGFQSHIEAKFVHLASLEGTSEPVARVRKQTPRVELDSGPAHPRPATTKVKKSKDGKGKKRVSKNGSSSNSSEAVSSPPKRHKTLTEVFPSIYSPDGAARFGMMRYPEAVGHNKLFFGEKKKEKKKKKGASSSSSATEVDGPVAKKTKKKMKESSASSSSSSSAPGAGAGAVLVASDAYKVPAMTSQQVEDAKKLQAFTAVVSHKLSGEMDGLSTVKLQTIMQKELEAKGMNIDSATFDKLLRALHDADKVFIDDAGSVVYMI